MGSSVSFRKLKKTISGIKKLECLRLPTSMNLVHTDEDQWPQSLIDLSVGGRVDYETMLDFCWPDNLEKLTLDHCVNLDLDTLGATLGNKRLSQVLRELTIGPYNHGMWEIEVENEESDFPVVEAIESMEKLRHLKLPADLALMLLDGIPRVQASPVQVLEIAPAQSGYELDLDSGEILPMIFLQALQNQYSNVWCFKVCSEAGLFLNDDYRQKIDDEVWLHLPDNDDDPQLAEFESLHSFGLIILDETN
jgi:hypothetical protein